MPSKTDETTSDQVFESWFQRPDKRREDRDYQPDCLSQMRILRTRPDQLALALREMGITENGDGILEDE